MQIWIRLGLPAVTGKMTFIQIDGFVFNHDIIEGWPFVCLLT